jgi:hypothetical protein
MAILHEFARTSNLATLNNQLPHNSILDSLKKGLKNDNQMAMNDYLQMTRDETENLENDSNKSPILEPSSGSSRSGVKIGFFTSPIFGSGDLPDINSEFGSFEPNFSRLLSDPLHGDMTSADLMRNWIQEDDEDDVGITSSGSLDAGAPCSTAVHWAGGAEFGGDHLAMDGELSDRSPIDNAMAVRYPSTPDTRGVPQESPLSNAPALPMMLRQEERPKRKGYMGKQSAGDITPSTPAADKAAAEEPLQLSPVNEKLAFSEPISVFSPSKDREMASPAPETPEKSGSNLPSSPEGNTGADRDASTVGSPMGPQVVDSSVLGDYCHWTAGPRLTATGMRQLYSGLFATALDEAEAGMAGKEDGSGSSSSNSSSSSGGMAGTAASLLPMLLGGMRGQKTAASPLHSRDKEGQREVLTSQPGATAAPNPTPSSISTNVSASSTNAEAKGSTSTNGGASGSLAIAPSSKHRTAVRGSRVLEIVTRPDILLKEIMTMCYKASRATVLRCTMSQNCHMVLETAEGEASRSAEPYVGKGSWNTIDIQVCISKELRQRVCVLQFLQVDGAAPNKRPLVTRGPAQYQQFLVSIQRLFTTGKISLSGLYKAPAKVSIITSLDVQFIEQLRNVCREDMWSVLRSQIVEMDAQILEAEKVSAVLLSLMDPLYRQHGIGLEVLDGLKEKGTVPAIAEAASTLPTEGGDGDAVPEERKAGMEGCLLLLEFHKRRFQRRYDRELTNRLRKRLLSTIAICEALGDYRRAVLQTLVDHPAAKVSSLAKAFSAAFDGLEVSSSPDSEAMYIKYNAISEADYTGNTSPSGSNNSSGSNHGHVEIVDKEEKPKLKLKPSIFAGKARGSSDEDVDDMMFSRPTTQRGLFYIVLYSILYSFLNFRMQCQFVLLLIIFL